MKPRNSGLRRGRTASTYDGPGHSTRPNKRLQLALRHRGRFFCMVFRSFR